MGKTGMNRDRVVAFAAFVVANVGVVACVGGGGTLPEGLDTWEPAASFDPAAGREAPPASTDRPSRTNERPPRSGEVAPGTGGGPTTTSSSGGLDCSGTYVCQERGDRDVERVRLQPGSNGACSAGQGIVLEPDGRVTRNGRVVATWSATPTGFVVSGEDQTTCSRSSGAGATSGSSSSSSSGDNEAPPPPDGTSSPPSPSPLPPRDAGS